METQIKKPPHNLKQGNPDVKTVILIYKNTISVDEKNNASRREDVIIQRYAAVNLMLYFYPNMSYREVSEFVSFMSEKKGKQYSHATIIHAKNYHNEAYTVKNSNKLYVEFFNKAKQNVLKELI